MDKTERWLALVREVEDDTATAELLIWLEVRRELRGERNWQTKAKRFFAERLAEAQEISEERAYRSDNMLRAYWDALVDFAVRKAIRAGLLEKKEV